MVYKLKRQKISLSLRLEPSDALEVLGWLHERGMITTAMYAGKGQRIMAEYKIIKKMANKE